VTILLPAPSLVRWGWRWSAYDRVGLVAQSLPCGHILEAHECHDVPGDGRLDLCPLVRVHLEHAADALVLPHGQYNLT